MSVELVKKYFENTELDGKVLEFPTSSATVELAAVAVGTEPDRIAKTLAFLLGEEAIVIVVSGLSRIDNKKFKAQFHTKAKMIPFAAVEEYLGHPPGGVCPFALKEGVKVYLDVSLRAHEAVFPAAGSENSAIETTIDQLERFTSYKEWVDVCKK
ncbi:MAG: YbaK/EbsC family protein [Lachnospiraceae bacterium]|nr:YbaK/EbsC family protein [Lachnospiraceae bacterium]